MAEINAKGGVRVVDGKAYVHPLTLPELEFLLEILTEAKYKLEDGIEELIKTYTILISDLSSKYRNDFPLGYGIK